MAHNLHSIFNNIKKEFLKKKQNVIKKNLYTRYSPRKIKKNNFVLKRNSIFLLFPEEIGPLMEFILFYFKSSIQFHTTFHLHLQSHSIPKTSLPKFPFTPFSG